MSNAKRKELADTGRGPAGKAAVVGMKDRETNRVVALHVGNTDSATLGNFVAHHARFGSTVYTDETRAYNVLDLGTTTRRSSTPSPSTLRGKAHTNGIESFWAMLKRAHTGTFHNVSHKHMQRYVSEFGGKHNIRESGTLDQMAEIVSRLMGRTLGYRRLIAYNGLSSGARQ